MSQNLMWVMIPRSGAPGTGTPDQAAPVAAVSLNGGEQGALAVMTLTQAGGGGAAVQLLGLSDNFDNVAPLDGSFSSLYQGSVARLTGYDATADQWDRLRTTPDNVTNQAPLEQGVLATISRLQVFDGNAEQWNMAAAAADDIDIQDTSAEVDKLVTLARGQLFNGSLIAAWNRMRDASAPNVGTFQGTGVQLVNGGGEWAIQHQPAAATQATITRAAAGAGIRHVCKSITVSLAAVAAQGAIVFNLRDGASGAGTILWSVTLIAPAGEGRDVVLSGLNIVGSEDTAMTLESAVAPAATNFANVSLTGYDAQNA